MARLANSDVHINKTWGLPFLSVVGRRIQPGKWTGDGRHGKVLRLINEGSQSCVPEITFCILLPELRVSSQGSPHTHRRLQRIARERFGGAHTQPSWH